MVAAAVALCSAGWHCATVAVHSSEKTNEPSVRKGCPDHKVAFSGFKNTESELESDMLTKPEVH